MHQHVAHSVQAVRLSPYGHQRAPAITLAIGALLVALVTFSGCRKDEWLLGPWLLVDEGGRPAACYSFEKGGTYKGYSGIQCDGQADPLLSGRWQLLKDDELALQPTGSLKAQLARIRKRTASALTLSGALAGSLHRVGEKKGERLVEALRHDGVIRMRTLEAAFCARLGQSMATLRTLPAEDEPRMLRASDQGLVYHKEPGKDPDIAKVVYAINQDQLDWIAVHLTAHAFRPPGPDARLEQALGAPAHLLSTGSGIKRQSIAMWRAYCPEIRGTINREVDLTLFFTPGEQDGVYYLSEGVVADLWEELRQAVRQTKADEE